MYQQICTLVTHTGYKRQFDMFTVLTREKNILEFDDTNLRKYNNNCVNKN